MRMPGILSAAQSGGGGYTAKAVHFDGAATLNIASLAATDNDTFSFAMWLNIAVFAGLDPIFATDPDNNYTTSLGPTAGGAVDFDPADVTGTKEIREITVTAGLPAATWFCLMGSVNTTTAVFTIYNGDTSIYKTPAINNSPFNLVNNGVPFWFGGDDNHFFTGDVSNVFILPGTAVDFSDVAKRRLFIDGSGKPVDPATATAALGTPCILFSGDHTTFPTNQGSGGAFTLTGTLTDASTHP